MESRGLCLLSLNLGSLVTASAKRVMLCHFWGKVTTDPAAPTVLLLSPESQSKKSGYPEARHMERRHVGAPADSPR